MPILTISKLADELFLRPIVISMNSLALSALMSCVMSANGGIDWRPITICASSDILAMGADHLKDKEEEFSSDRNNVNDPRLASWFIYARTFLTANTRFALISKRLLKKFGRDKHQPYTSAPVFVIKRIPGMKAIFNGIIRGCGIYTVVFSVLSGSGNLTNTLPSPWSVAQLIVWSTVNRTCHAIMTDVRDFEDDMKAGVPTIPVLLGSILKTKVILTACHMLVMLAFIENTYIMGSCLSAAALVWMLGNHSPKKAFLFSSHSQSLFIIWYLLTRHI
ncbi:hypothetical protein BDR04DRAFT_1086912 [Suillus decipiens]|nr:hypothetical protein BDR04DRAFT_1086912 [Suillus decipiens]